MDDDFVPRAEPLDGVTEADVEELVQSGLGERLPSGFVMLDMRKLPADHPLKLRLARTSGTQ